MTIRPPDVCRLGQLVGGSVAAALVEERIRVPTIWRQACSEVVAVRDIDEMLRSPGWTRRHLRLAKDGEPIPPREFETADGRTDMRAAWDHFGAGASLILHRMERGLPVLAGLVREIAREVEGRAWVTGYVSPPRRGAFAVHADTHNVLVLQIGGTKNWTIEGTVRDDVRREEVSEVCLAPGDMLYIPQGVRHSAASGMELSTHLSLGFRRHTWEELVVAVLAARPGVWKGASTRRDNDTFAADLDGILSKIRHQIISGQPESEESSVHPGAGLSEELQLVGANLTDSIRSLGSWQLLVTHDEVRITNNRYAVSVSHVAKNLLERLYAGQDIAIAELDRTFETAAWRSLLAGLVRGGFITLLARPTA